MTYTTFHEFMEQNIFQPYPPKLVFQNFTAGETYKLPLQLFNRDNVSKYVKLELPETKYFQVTSPENATGKVAPGLSANFTIVFTPQENKDYQHHLVCVTEKKSFEIPIVAIGPRAILDFRDELFLPVCPVKATSEKTVLVRNVGNCKANFKLQTKGEQTVSLTNTSGVPLQYHWTTHPSRSKQDMPRGTLLHPREQQEAFLNEPNPAIIHGSELLSTAAQDPLPDFSNDCAITLEPTAGEIWPNVTIEFLIIFKPDTAGLYRQTLYCDVTELNFGDVAYGFPAASICTLFNQSFVPMTFSLRVLGDGSGPPSVSCVQQLNEKSRSQWQSCTAKDRRVRPKEFIVSPQTDCVRAMSQVNIKRQRKSFWHVEPKEGEVPANSQLELRVVAHLKDTLLFEDKLDVSVQDSGTLTVSVKGIGTGYTLVSNKPFAPSLDLGAHFRYAHPKCDVELC
uniref:Uncharacterized protein n=1 Tax=Knipowitschia caucasica TaxID=637954 RepID=A0AAV2KZ11_KNICA